MHMGSINRLPPGLANQIAAGEVVERPASVVKELIENSIDAGSLRIIVTVEFGGKRLIRVEDDGIGMSSEDALLAIERHATSKIGRLEDLNAIATLGFRGEALPSVASVSHLLLRTRSSGTSHGVEVRVDGGGEPVVTETGIREGTTVEVRDLFFNVPARRKFLKSDGAETSHISRAMTQIALGYCGVGFTLVSGRRTLIDCPPVASFPERFYQVYGERTDLVSVEKQAAGIRLFGFVAALAEQGPTRGAQHLFVNGRMVKDKTIAHAVIEAYSQASIKPRSPEIHLFLEIPHDRVDVNVHPTKAEVRFLEQSLVHELVRRGMADALGQEAVPVIIPSLPSGISGQEPQPRSIPGVVSGMAAASRWGPAADVFRQRERVGTVSSFEGSLLHSGLGTTDRGDVGTTSLIPLGQFRDTFIVAVDNDGVVIIDQHVAHERILFEQVMDRLTAGTLESQRLLEPLVVELPPASQDALAEHTESLTRLGFEVDSFGGDSVRIAAAPNLLVASSCERVVRALADDLEGLDKGADVDEALRQIAATTACHAAVKANDRLTVEKMTYLLQELKRTAYSTVCPHGRPVLLRLSRHQLEKSFDRI
ncbi:MAG TPA: DNA mismatch repair endonuclease MutL [Acidobacteria bacterium]|nr:DNA mismatch repair endonuclease MutL [Acidobacteriota bacterium]